MMGLPNQDLVFKLKSIGVRVEGDDAHIDTDIIQAILQGKNLPHPREVIMRDEPAKEDAMAQRRRTARRMPVNPLRPARPRTLIQKVEPRIPTLPASERPRAVAPPEPGGAAGGRDAGPRAGGGQAPATATATSPSGARRPGTAAAGAVRRRPPRARRPAVSPPSTATSARGETAASRSAGASRSPSPRTRSWRISAARSGISRPTKRGSPPRPSRPAAATAGPSASSRKTRWIPRRGARCSPSPRAVRRAR